MRAMEMRDAWGIDHIVEGTRPDPGRPGAGEALIRFEAASLNYRDLVMAQHGYGRMGSLPFIPVSDGAGRVIATGAGVTRVAVGDLVCPSFLQGWVSGPLREAYRGTTMGGDIDGVMRERALFPEAGLVRAPRDWTAVEAATLPCAAVTAWNAVVGNGTRPGDVVVTEGTGGVSLFALQFAKLAGATVVVTSSSDEKLARARAMGADIAVNYHTHPEWARLVRERAGRGADLVIDVGGAASLDQAVRATRTNGTVALVGVVGGASARLELGRVVTQAIRLAAATCGSREMFEDMVRAIETHRIRPAIDDRVFGFAQVADALRALGRGRHFGKICLAFEETSPS
ncbi:MAG: NAD(P)-dependent alcohol dehydrogenase [Alphaproteobacteria bacterium]|nr:NAD(P)-dependent alcohol dehydrogenase [Alphaproteobacteria bacterium]